MSLRADHGLSAPPPPPAPLTHKAHSSVFNPDMVAAFMGLIGGSVALLILVMVVVKLTAMSFEGHETPAAGGAQHAAPAGGHAPAPGAAATPAPAAGAPATTTPAPGAPPAAGAPAAGTPAAGTPAAPPPPVQS